MFGWTVWYHVTYDIEDSPMGKKAGGSGRAPQQGGQGFGTQYGGDRYGGLAQQGGDGMSAITGVQRQQPGGRGFANWGGANGVQDWINRQGITQGQGQSPWTPERMDNAQTLPMGRGGGGMSAITGVQRQQLQQMLPPEYQQRISQMQNRQSGAAPTSFYQGGMRQVTPHQATPGGDGGWSPERMRNAGTLGMGSLTQNPGNGNGGWSPERMRNAGTLGMGSLTQNPGNGNGNGGWSPERMRNAGTLSMGSLAQNPGTMTAQTGVQAQERQKMQDMIVQQMQNPQKSQNSPQRQANIAAYLQQQFGGGK